jgi:hypothetical protein
MRSRSFRPSRSLFVSAASVSLLAAAAPAQIVFQPATTHALVGQRPDAVATGDFDGDGDRDFAVSTGQPSGVNGPERVEVFLNDGSGSFTAGQALVVGSNVGAGALVAADLDRDGDLDLALAMHGTGRVQVLLNAAGTFVLGTSAPVNASEPRALAAGDIDQDGDLDVVASNRESSTVSVLSNDGAGALAFVATIAVGVEPRGVALEDLDGDGALDLAVAAQDSRRVEIRFGDGLGGFGVPVSIAIPGNEKPSGLVAADLDDDGDVDLATTGDDNDVGLVFVLANLGGGTFSATATLSGGVDPDAIVAFDLDGDGDEDLAFADQAANAVGTLSNLGGVAYGAPASFAAGVRPGGIAGTDVDGDGSIDLIVANRDSNDVRVLRNANAGGVERYCSTSVNSFGAGARIDSSGSTSLAANGFALSVRGAPPAHNGIFFYGATSASVPVGAGFRCIASPVVRLGPPLVTGADGRAVRPLDFTAPPLGAGASQVLAGSTWNFQFWYRDPFAGKFVNFSDALSATFRP